MRKKNLKPMIISTLLAIGFGASTVGTSFALFTDKADTSISVTSGLVDIKSVAKLVRYYSSIDKAKHDFGATETSYTNDKVGTTFGLNGNTINISKMVPGDELTFSLTAINKSNVRTKTRYTLAHALLGEKADLFPALKIEYAMEGDSITNDPKEQIFRWKANEAVAEAHLAEGTKLHTILVTVKFPNDDNEIRAREEGENNKYQDAACSITFGLEAVQANANTDPIAEINAYLNAKAMMEGHNATMHDAVNDMKELGYTLPEFVGFGTYAWSVATDQFVPAASVTANKNEYFKICASAVDANGFSIYAGDSWTTASVAVDGVGFDAGDVANIITKVRYTNTSGSAKTNIIRTNSLDTEVEINAATDVVKHYGDAKKVTIEAVAGSSYHEYGRVAVVDIANGRIALEKTAEVTQMHFTATEDVFNKITVAYDQAVELPKFSRDAVEEIPASGKLVVKLENDVDQPTKTDYIWLYQQGLVQQMRVSESADSAGNVKATDTGVSADTHQVAEDIANAIKPEASYTPAQIDAGDVDSEDVVEHGIAAEDKDEYIDNVVEEVISEDAKEKGGIVRIGAKYYETFQKAVVDFKSGDTIRVLKNHSDSHYYNFSGKNLTLHVEEGATFTLDNPQNHGTFQTGWNNAGSTFNFEGSGKIVFAYSSAQPLVGENGSSDSTLNVKDLTIECTAAGGKLADIAHLNIYGGQFKNISFHSNAIIYDGFFTDDVEDYLIEGKMLGVSLGSEYPYYVTNLDEAHASFKVIDSNEQVKSYFKTMRAAGNAAQPSDTIKFVGASNTVTTTGMGSNADFIDLGTKNNITIDLNNHTLVSRSGSTSPSDGYKAIVMNSVVNGEMNFTIKNGTVDADLLTLDNNVIQNCNFTVYAENLSIKDSCENVFTHIVDTNTKYVHDALDSYTINPAEMPLASEYTAQLFSTNHVVGERIYTSANGVTKAMAAAGNGDTVYVYQYESGARATLSALDETLRVEKKGENTSGFDFPEVGSTVGQVDFVTNGNVRDYIVNKATVCSIEGVDSYESLAEGIEALKDYSTTRNATPKTLKLTKDITLNGGEHLDGDASGGVSSYGLKVNKGVFGNGSSSAKRVINIDFHGHTVYGGENVTNALLWFMTLGSTNSDDCRNNTTLNLMDESAEKKGGLYNAYGGLISVSGNCTINILSGTYTTLTAGSSAINFNNNNNTNKDNRKISGGIFLSNYSTASNVFYVNYGKPYTVTAGIFRADVLTSLGLSTENADIYNLEDEVFNSYTYYKYPKA